MTLFGPIAHPLSNPETIEFRVPAAGYVRSGICDAQGREIAVLLDGTQEQGDHEVVLDAKTLELTEGIYVCRLQAGGASVSSKVAVTD